MRALAWTVAAGMALALASPTSAADTSLLDAIRGGETAAVNALLQGGADPNVRDETGATPLMYAAIYSSQDTMRLLLDHGADVNAANSNGSTPLMWATGDTPKVRLLLERGAAANAKTSDGTTALMTAAYRGNTAGMELLLAGGAQPKTSPEETASLLRSAYSLDSPIDYPRERAAMRRLLAGAGIELKEAAQLTNPLSPNLGDAKTVAQLLDLGANPNEGFSLATLRVPALAVAAFAGRVDAIRALIDRGADPGLKGTRGLTPLMMAAAGSRPSVAAVRLLIDRGAEVDARDERGRSALDWALTQGETPVARVLRKAGATAAVSITATPAPVAKPRTVRAAVEKAVSRLQPIGPAFNQRTKCISCHNESLPGVAVAVASAHGVAVDRELARHPTDATLAMWAPRKEAVLLGRRTIPGFLENVTYGLFAFAEEGVAPNPVTDAVTLALATDQHPDGAWRALDIRPPLGDASPLPYTALAVRALSVYSPPGQREAALSRIAKAREFVRETTPGDTQDEAFKLLALVWAGAPTAEVSRQSRRLGTLQRPDGGWGQLPTMGPDAYATGQALYALYVSGVSTKSAAYQKGVEYLLRAQLEDGSWFVRSRAFAFQPYFDAGFPHATDQFISAAATSWAAIALARVL